MLVVRQLPAKPKLRQSHVTMIVLYTHCQTKIWPFHWLAGTSEQHCVGPPEILNYPANKNRTLDNVRCKVTISVQLLCKFITHNRAHKSLGSANNIPALIVLKKVSSYKSHVLTCQEATRVWHHVTIKMWQLPVVSVTTGLIIKFEGMMPHNYRLIIQTLSWGWKAVLFDCVRGVCKLTCLMIHESEIKLLA